MNGDIFTSSNHVKPVVDDNNFFMQTESVITQNFNQDNSRHLNDLDSNILKDGAYRDVKDEIFKLEYQISRKEKELLDVENQINAAKDINDYLLLESLDARRRQLKLDLKELTEIYNGASLSTKISGGIVSNIRNKVLETKAKISSSLDLLMSKMPGKISSIVELKSSLSKLENINKSVDELMTRQYPFGESADRYEQLSRYIARANSIQSQIVKFIK